MGVTLPQGSLAIPRMRRSERRGQEQQEYDR